MTVGQADQLADVGAGGPRMRYSSCLEQGDLVAPAGEFQGSGGAEFTATDYQDSGVQRIFTPSQSFTRGQSSTASWGYYPVMSGRWRVAILLFDEVEVLDFAGPFEVFSVCGRRDGSDPFEVVTVAEKEGPISARNGLEVTPTYTLRDCPQPDIIVVPGGFGTRALMTNPVVIEWLSGIAGGTELILSVCTGSLVLAKAGLLEGLEATTHHGALDLLEEVAPETTVRRDVRVVDNGKVVTSAGVSAGMDMSFHVVARLLGEEQARETAAYIEYPWRGAGD